MISRRRRRDKKQEASSAPRFSDLLPPKDEKTEAAPLETPPYRDGPMQRDGFDSIVRNGIAHVHPM